MVEEGLEALCSLPNLRHGPQELAQVSLRSRGHAPEGRQTLGKTQQWVERVKLAWVWLGGAERCSDAERPPEGAQAPSFGH